jgi:hypothetical protein
MVFLDLERTRYYPTMKDEDVKRLLRELEDTGICPCSQLYQISCALETQEF